MSECDLVMKSRRSRKDVRLPLMNVTVAVSPVQNANAGQQNDDVIKS